jgi:hypothetical protein
MSITGLILVELAILAVVLICGVYYKIHYKKIDKSSESTSTSEKQQVCPLCGKPLRPAECDWEHRFEYSLTCDCGYGITSSFWYNDLYKEGDIDNIREICKKPLDKLV